MPKNQSNQNSLSSLFIQEICCFIISNGLLRLANTAITVVIGLQVYKLTHSALALGMLGLVEAIPAISIFLLGGHVADRFDRRRIILITKAIAILCSLLLAFISFNHNNSILFELYIVIFLAGIARGFLDPASTAFEAQVVPRNLTVNASSWIGSTGLVCAVIGPVIGGFSYQYLGIVNTYLIIASFFALSFIFTVLIKSKPLPVNLVHESIKKSIGDGLKFVFKEQALVGSMALDLFAVFFGGAIALLPIFATDILKVDARGLGMLQAAPAFGSLVVMLISTHHPPIRHAGRNLLFCVAGFGISIIIFALSKNFILSLIALTFSGIFDGISMVIRRSIVRLLSPDHMRGRVAAVSWIFIGASNELGAFESGVAAHLLGTVPAVWIGGAITLLIVAGTSLWAPKLRQLRFDPHKLERVN